ncbi:MAG: glycine--tRNA ligase subunit beta [Rhodobacteraceae bacterium]|nr:glycine--tRNA ligase subunit beta [Paracoccaceae bacterium]
MQHLLLEVRCEEIPATLQESGARRLADAVGSELAEAGLAATAVSSYSTPRRLVAVLSGMPQASAPVTHERRGPRVGAPQRAIAGFLRSAGADAGQLEVRSSRKGEYYFAVTVTPGRRLEDVASERVRGAIEGLVWPKSMRWGSGNFRWVRPIRSLLCILFDDEGNCRNVEFEVAGIQSGNTTRGHRFLSPGDFPVRSFAEYEAKLRDAWVMLSATERRDRIRAVAESFARERRLVLWQDEELLKEIAGLVEWPNPILGRVPARYRSLPREILRTAIRRHQKYLSLCRCDGDQVTHFVTVANNKGSVNDDAIRKGNTRVLCARLEDAEFHYAADMQFLRHAGLDSFNRKLEDVSYHASLGSQWQRVERIAGLARAIAEHLNADVDVVSQAARHCKADLASQVIDEFPELQGVMGSHYAKADGLDANVCKAIEQHYRPVGDGSELPSDTEASCVALADRINHLCGFALAGERTTGSKDPHALRRAALAAIRIVLENEYVLPLDRIVQHGLANYLDDQEPGDGGKFVDRLSAERQVMEFVMGRFVVLLRRQGIERQYIDACMSSSKRANLLHLRQHVECLRKVASDCGIDNLAQPSLRAGSILRAAGIAVPARAPAIDPELFGHESEHRLFSRLQQLEGLVASMDERFTVSGCERTLRAIHEMNAPLEAFFSSVLVNDTNKAVRKNRLGLLAWLEGMCMRVADFSRLHGGA